jgi:hypothetical protein
MKRRILGVAAFAGLVAAAGSTAFAEDEAERAKLNGAWQAQESGVTQAVWNIQQTATGMRVVSSQGEKKIVEFVCDFGKDCDAKDAGKKVKVTLYFNGPKLVVMERRGDEVVKLRFGFADAADVMELETLPVAPAGPALTAHFTRLQTASAAKP